MQSILFDQVVAIAAAQARSEGLKVYLVGGTVRRLLAGDKMADLDLVVDAPRGAQILAEVLSKKIPYASRPVAIGGTFPLVEVRAGKLAIQISEPIRKLTLDVGGIHSSLSDAMKQDALRRDFTVNTLLALIDVPTSAGVIDPLGCGKEDLAARRLRTPREPRITIDDDPIRMLRAVRFANLDGFDVDSELAATIRDSAPKITGMPGERIAAELSKILTGPKPSAGFRMLAAFELLHYILPEVAELAEVDQPGEFHGDDVLSHSLKVLDAVRPDLVLRLAALLHDVGKSATRAEKEGKVVFYGHQYTGSEEAREALRRLRYPSRVIEAVTRLIEMHMIAYRSEWSDSAVRRLVHKADELLPALIELYRADVAARKPPHNDVSLVEELQHRVEELDIEQIRSVRSPLSGEEVMEILEIDPGPAVGEAMSAIETAIIDGKIAQDEDAARRFLTEDYKRRRKELSGGI